jgi:hypothetical protein
MFEESIVACCDPMCAAVGNCAAAVNAAAAAVAVAGGAAGVDAPPDEAGLDLPVPEAEMRFCVSKVLSAAALLWLSPIALPAADDAEALLVGEAGAPGTTAGAGIAAASAPASACSRKVSALATWSAADCLAAGWLGPVASDAWDLAAEASVAAAPSAGVAASDWASAAEKSLVSAAAAVVPAAA